MPRIHPIDPSTASAAVTAQLEGTRKMLGLTPNMFTTAANSPAALIALNGFFAALAKGSLGGKIGERVAIAIAQENHCEYCLSAHTALGAMHGVDAAELSNARSGNSTDAKANAAIALALAIVKLRGQVDDAVLTSARNSGLSEGEIVEVVAHVALNVFTNYLNNVSETVVDFPVVAIDAVAA